MSALPPKADIRQCIEDVCFVPLADIALTEHEGNHNNAADDYWANKIAPLHHLVQGAAPVEQHDAGVIAQLFNCGLVVR